MLVLARRMELQYAAPPTPARAHYLIALINYKTLNNAPNKSTNFVSNSNVLLSNIIYHFVNSITCEHSTTATDTQLYSIFTLCMCIRIVQGVGRSDIVAAMHCGQVHFNRILPLYIYHYIQMMYSSFTLQQQVTKLVYIENYCV